MSRLNALWESLVHIHGNPHEHERTRRVKQAKRIAGAMGTDTESHCFTVDLGKDPTTGNPLKLSISVSSGLMGNRLMDKLPFPVVAETALMVEGEVVLRKDLGYPQNRFFYSDTQASSSDNVERLQEECKRLRVLLSYTITFLNHVAAHWKTMGDDTIRKFKLLLGASDAAGMHPGDRSPDDSVQMCVHVPDRPFTIEHTQFAMCLSLKDILPGLTDGTKQVEVMSPLQHDYGQTLRWKMVGLCIVSVRVTTTFDVESIKLKLAEPPPANPMHPDDR